MGFDNRHFAASLYTRSPYAHCMPCLPQYGRWDFEKDTGAVHRIWYSHSSKVKHLPILRPPPFTRTQISSAINRQSFHSRTINLCSRWPYYELPGLRSSYTRMRASNSLWLARKFLLFIYFSSMVQGLLVLGYCPLPYVTLWVDCVWNVMAHAQKPDFVFRRNGRVHLNRWGCQFNHLLAAEVCASAVVMLDTPSSEVVKGTGYPLHSPVSPSLPLPCVTVCHHASTGLLTHYRWNRQR